MRLSIVALALILCLAAQIRPMLAAEPVAFQQSSGRIKILVGGQQFATYVYNDVKVPRPYFVDVHEPGGVQVTRNHPPRDGDDKDHPHHTGFFFTFGSLNGVDYWHLKGHCHHQRFLATPTTENGRGTFTVANRYFIPSAPDQTVLQETAKYVIRPLDHSSNGGVILEWDHTLSATQTAVHFGSKEEGGLAVRVATPIAVGSNVGGQLRDSNGRSGGKSIWGQQAAWVDYSGTINGRHAGVTIVPHPKNFSECWYHARDYGLLGANPFGPLNKGKGLRLEPGHSLRLRFATIIHGHTSQDKFDIKQVVQNYTSN